MEKNSGKKAKTKKVVLFYKKQNGLCPHYVSQLVPNTVSDMVSYNLGNAGIQTISAVT